MSRNHSVKGSVNYTVVGSPTVVNGVVSGFSSSNYLQIDSNFSPSNNIWEAVIKINLTNATTTQTIINGKPLGGIAAPFGISFRSNGKLRLYLFLDGTSSPTNVGTSTHTLSTGELYIKLEFTGTKYILYTSTNKSSWTEEISYTSTTQVKQAGVSKLCFGVEWNTSSAEPFLGSIDLNETYITVNGQPWFGVCPVEVKHINYGTNVGYTVVGNPTIVNGVASGFSSSDYLKVNSSLDVENNKWQIVVKALCTSFANKGTLISRDNNISNIQLGVTTDRKLNLYLYANDNTNILYNGTSTLTISADTWYWYLLEFTGTQYKLSVSTDKENWTPYITTDSSKTLRANSINHFGYNNSSYPETWNGSIDLNETYIKVNGKLWFFRPCTNYQVHNGKLVFADSNLYLSGPVNYTKVGSPSIVDGIYSGITTNDYLVSSSQLSSSNQSAELQISGICNGTTADVQYGITWVDSTSNLCFLGLDTSGHVRIQWAPNMYETSTQVVAFNEKIYLKAVFENSALNVLYKTGNTDWATVITNQNATFTSIDTLAFGHANFSVNWALWNGSIDLKETYVKVGGTLWLYGKNYASKNIAPVPAGYHTKGQVGCVAVGSPTIVDGAVSGFSNNNYLTLNNVFNPGNYNWEFCTKVNPTLTGAASYIISRSSPTYRSGFGIAIGTSTIPTAILNLSSDGETNDIANGERGSHNYSQNTNYWIKLRFTGTQYILSYSLDDITYIDDIAINSSTKIYGANGFLAIGVNRYTTTGNIQPFGGSIDLNNTYIKVNNKMWFDGRGQYPFTGYVDMRTQAFTAAPSGATIGKDE